MRGFMSWLSGAVGVAEQTEAIRFRVEALGFKARGLGFGV